MRKPIDYFVKILFILAISQKCFSQTETFDIATFTPPAGWQRIDSNGAVLFHDMKTNNGLTSFCQIFLYPSRVGGNNAMKNFQDEWKGRVVKATSTKKKPATGTEKTPEGWTVVTGQTNITNQGVTYTVIFVTATGFGKVMSALVNVAGPDYMPAIQSFFDKLNLDPKGTPGNQNHQQLMISGSGSLANYIYTAPPGWTITPYNDGIVVSSPPSNMGEKCNITLWPMRPASGNLQNDALTLFGEVFKAYEPKSSSTSGSMIKGISTQGWEYFIVKQPIGLRGGDYQTMFGFAFVANLNGQLAAISGISKDPMVSSCFGFLMANANVWPRFFYNLQFRNWTTPSGSQQKVAARLTGVWTTASATASDRFVFASNGRFAGTAAAQRYYGYSSAQLLVVTDAYFGDGAYTITGNSITLVYDSDKNNPERALLRVEQESSDGGRTWGSKLYLLKKNVTDGGEYEVNYDKQNGN